MAENSFSHRKPTAQWAIVCEIEGITRLLTRQNTSKWLYIDGNGEFDHFVYVDDEGKPIVFEPNNETEAVGLEAFNYPIIPQLEIGELALEYFVRKGMQGLEADLQGLDETSL